MTRPERPVDARAAKRTLRRHVVLIPVATLVGGWCCLLQIAWAAFPDDVPHMPAAVRLAAGPVAALCLLWLGQVFCRLPALIDDILEHGLLASGAGVPAADAMGLETPAASDPAHGGVEDSNGERS